MDEGDRWELEPGGTFAGYQIERKLGRGGMGMVYAATEPGLNRRVALKLILPEAAAEEVFRQRFAHESQIAASIEHPHVVPIYAAGEEDGVPWIAMRYVSGSDLGKRIAINGRLSPGDAVRITAQVAGGLDALHAVGLIHRDVKPANVLLSGPEGSEHSYLTDFGVARNVASTSGLTKTGRFVGTLDYVAPEQIRGGQIDARVDVYALACMLFKALTGEVPFPREAEAARLYAHLNDDPPAPSLIAPLVPAALDPVIARGMAKDPDQRFPSAGDLGRAAEAALRGADVSVAERTVAIGAAAGALPDLGSEPPSAEATGAPPAPEGYPGTEVAPGSGHSAAQTIHMPDTMAPGEGQQQRPRSGAVVLIGFIVAIGVIAAFALQSGGSNGGSDRAGGSAVSDTDTTDTSDTTTETTTLTRTELISLADQACELAQNEFLAAKAEFPDGEDDLSQAVPFAERLADISGRQVASMDALEPPAEIAAVWEDYMDLRQAVHTYDTNAFEAASGGDLAGFQFWRQANTDEADERAALARQIGLVICSP